MNINQSTDDSFSLTTTLGRGMALARLIDDELTTAQERELLKHLDGHPELWRHCALGFLEERALRRGSRGWVMAQKTNTTSVPLAPPIGIDTCMLSRKTPGKTYTARARQLNASLL